MRLIVSTLAVTIHLVYSKVNGMKNKVHKTEYTLPRHYIGIYNIHLI